jgi:hypothetical protein
MYFYKEPKVMITIILASTLLFYLANSHSIASRAANLIAPCKQDPTTSFPCYGGYDIALMLISAILIVSFSVTLIVYFIKN